MLFIFIIGTQLSEITATDMKPYISFYSCSFECIIEKHKKQRLAQQLCRTNSKRCFTHQQVTVKIRFYLGMTPSCTVGLTSFLHFKKCFVFLAFSSLYQNFLNLYQSRVAANTSVVLSCSSSWELLPSHRNAQLKSSTRSDV